MALASQKERLISTNERDFLLQALKEEKRVDGRRPYDMRTLKITVGPVPGEALVLLGQTRVYCVVSCELTEPYERSSCEFSPMASPVFETGRQSEAAIELGRVVERGLRESKAIDAEALCILSGTKVWSVHVTIHVLDHGGNLIDCASIATITALLHFRRPDVSISGDQVTVHSAQDREPVPLSIHHLPIAITFALFDEGNMVLVDPSVKEELVMDGRMTITMNAHREICAVQKAGGTPITAARVVQCSKIAAVKVAEITAIIQSTLKSSRDIKVVVRPLDSDFLEQLAAPLVAAKTSKKGQPTQPAPLIVTSEETYFEGGQSAWKVEDNQTVSMMTSADRAEFSQLANKFLDELAVNLNQTPADAEMVEAPPAPVQSAPPAAASTKRTDESKRKGPESDSEEEPTVAVVSMDAAVSVPPEEHKKPDKEEKKVKPAAPATAPEGDLSLALKKKHAKKKAGREGK